jgi:tetratricopeptide (TPR) repeat protein
VVINPEQQVDASSQRAMESYRRFLELQNTDPKLRAEALRRLGDLNLEAGDPERLASEINAIDLQGGEAIKLYSALLQAYPDYPRNDQVLYQLARAYETTGQPERALSSLDDLVRRYPNAQGLDEVQFRRGEILFSARNYPAAQDAYQAVIDRGSNSAFYDKGLYKHGWSLFKQGLNEDSLPSFTRVLDATLLDGAASSRVKTLEELPRAERELADDTMRVMSIIFSYGDGAPDLDRYMTSRGNPPYAPLLYSRLGDLYVEKERFQDGATTYRALVTRDPNNELAPSLLNQAIEAYRKGGLSPLVIEGKREYVEKYGLTSAFWQGRDPARYESITKELRGNLKDVATYYHAAAQKSKRPADFGEASRWYRTYLEWYPNDAESAATNYLLAETLLDSQDYAGAASEFERAAYQYPRNDKSAKAAYAALAAYAKQEERLQGAQKVAWHKQSVEASLKFAENFADHPDSAGVLTRAAQDIFAEKDLPRAVDVSRRILALQPPADAAKRRIAWTIVGQASFDLGDFAEAEKGYIAARELLPPSDKMRADLTERIAATVYKQGEAKQKAGDSAGAVEDFMRVSRVAPASKINATAQYDAGAQLINLKDWPRAIQVLEAYRRDYPKSEFRADVTRKLAVAYSEVGRPLEAASEFARIARDPNEEPAVQREALLQSADLYGKAGYRTRAAVMLEDFVKRYPQPLEGAMEARSKLADIAGQKGDLENQTYWRRELIRANRNAGAGRTDRTQAMAAKAQLALAEPARDNFNSIRLTLPLKQSLARKRKALESALSAYKAAADYRVGDVTTASTFEIAELYRGLGQDIMKSERPKGLTESEREEYDSLLEEQAFPFEEQAIATHEVNAKRVAEGFYDASVQKSFDALAKLKPARYGKTEVLQEVIDRAN